MRMRQHFHRYMIRPLIYQVSTRLAVTLAAILIVREFSGSGSETPVLPWGCLAASGVYLLLAWIAWLRLDGARLPALDHRLFRFKRRRDTFVGGDMADYIDEKPVLFEELEPEERDACLLACNLIACAAFAIAGALL